MSECEHMSAGGALEADRDGWFYAACTCGWEQGAPLPDLETAVDALMEHAFEVVSA